MGTPDDMLLYTSLAGNAVTLLARVASIKCFERKVPVGVSTRGASLPAGMYVLPVQRLSRIKGEGPATAPNGRDITIKLEQDIPYDGMYGGWIIPTVYNPVEYPVCISRGDTPIYKLIKINLVETIFRQHTSPMKEAP